MKYFTKEYYTLIDASCVGADLVASPSAKRKSENYFQHLYAERLKVWLDAAKERAAEKGTEYDEAAETENFKTNYQVQLRDLSTLLPRDILAQVADIRVMALGSCSSKVKQLVSKFSKQQEQITDTMAEAYHTYWEKSYRRFPEHILENYGFDYCAITALGRDGDDLIMKLDNSQSLDDVHTVIWKNAQLLELEDGVVGSNWLEGELYKAEGGYEFHGIVENDDGERFCFTVLAEDAQFLFDEEKRRKIQEAMAELAEKEGE